MAVNTQPMRLTGPIGLAPTGAGPHRRTLGIIKVSGAGIEQIQEHQQKIRDYLPANSRLLSAQPDILSNEWVFLVSSPAFRELGPDEEIPRWTHKFASDTAEYPHWWEEVKS